MRVCIPRFNYKRSKPFLKLGAIIIAAAALVVYLLPSRRTNVYKHCVCGDTLSENGPATSSYRSVDDMAGTYTGIIHDVSTRPHYTRPKDVTDCLTTGVGCQARADCACVSLNRGDVRDVTRRSAPRRLVLAFLFNHEFDLLDTMLHELGDVADTFLIVESNYTMFGDRRPLHLMNKFKSGWNQRYYGQIVYIMLGTFSEEGRKDGWAAERHHLGHVGLVGLKYIKGLQPDDMLVILDADEIPSREALLFLKHYGGYSEPVGFRMRWSVYGHFWKRYPAWPIIAACTVKTLDYVYKNDTYLLKHTKSHFRSLSSFMEQFTSGSLIRMLLENLRGNKVQRWYIGDDQHLAGWHCSWCYNPEGIRTKLVSAMNGDYPRWGDYPEKHKLPYIRQLICRGDWFDDTSMHAEPQSLDTDRQYAPRYMKDHQERFAYLLKNSYCSEGKG